MDQTREQLIAWLLGELSPEESRPIEARLATDAELQRQRGVLESTLRLARAVPPEDVSENAVQRLFSAAALLVPEEEAPTEVRAEVHADTNAAHADGHMAEVIRVNFMLRTVLPRVAAVAAIIFVFGLGVWLTPGKLEPMVAGVKDEKGLHPVLDGELVESRVGETRRITFPTGELLLDGASSVRVTSSGRYAPPAFEIERGRVVVTAASTPLQVKVADRDVRLDKGGVLAVDYDRAYANIAQDGSVVEIQRAPIGEVAALAEKVYGIKLEVGGIPENVRKYRVSFYGSGLDANAFIDSFVESASRFGVTLDDSRRFLGYQSRTGGAPLEEWQLDIALLEGRASVRTGADVVSLDGREPQAANYISVSAATPTDARSLDAESLSEQVVWAAGVDGAPIRHLRDVRQSNETLPSRTVIHTDTLVLNGEQGRRIFKLGGPEFDFPLPGGRKGRLVQLTSSGAAFEVEGELVREFVPFGQQAQD
ncbi:MAG: hypothetical protein H6841_01565 [Planctomycetes bacterium]|nr:hypothetical protein [Planctomycetota bacterium]MCB9935522.1 hypothetical protein [Planctomycetota bacterium]